MEIVSLYLIAVFFMFISIGAIGWMLYHSHTRNREIMIQRDQIQELQIRTFEMEKLRSIAAAEEEQMRRIGRFLHDEVGGNLHVLLHVLEKSETRSEKETIEILEKASALTKKSIDSVRNTSQELVPYFLLNGLHHRGLLSHSGIEVVTVHIHIEMAVFALRQFFCGQGSEHAFRTLRLFAVVVIRVLASRSAGEDHENSFKVN